MLRATSGSVGLTIVDSQDRDVAGRMNKERGLVLIDARNEAVADVVLQV